MGPQLVAAKTMVNKWIKLEDCKTGEILISAEYNLPGAKPIPNEESKQETSTPIVTEEAKVEKAPAPVKKDIEEEKSVPKQEEKPEPTVIKPEEKIALPE